MSVWTPQSAPKWTVMVFMGAATVKNAEPMFEAAAADLKEMSTVGSGDALNIFVQVHQGGNVIPRRGLIAKGMPGEINALEEVPSGQRDPARGRALESFILWALDQAQHDPRNDEHYSMLVLWGHAYDFAIGREQNTDGLIDPLDFAELYRVLERLQIRFGTPDAKLDILGFDACDLATVEAVCQLAPFAKYMLASEIGVPIPGWPYDRILDRLRHPIGDLMTPAQFGPYVVRRYCESYGAQSRTVSLSMLDLDRAQELSTLSGILALTLIAAIGDLDSRAKLAYLFKQSQTGPRKPFVDVADLCLNLARSNGNMLVTEAASALGDFLISPCPPLVGESASGKGRPFVLESGRNTGETARLNGISIYAPHVAPEKDFQAVRHFYENFFFAQETRWGTLVHGLAEAS